jgi:hypothetical protein
MFLLILALVACRREKIDPDPDTVIINPRNAFIGFYCGEATSTGSWGLYSTEIVKSPDDSSKLIILNFCDGADVEASVDSLHFVIPEQKFWVSQVSHYYGPYNYELFLSGEGTLDPITGHLNIDFNAVTKGPVYATGSYSRKISAYNATLFENAGIYSGTNEMIKITEAGDSLLFDISISSGTGPMVWERVSAFDQLCLIFIPQKSYTERNSGKVYDLSGGCSKQGDHLKVSLFVKWDDGTRMSIYEFLVKRE